MYSPDQIAKLTPEQRQAEIERVKGLIAQGHTTDPTVQPMPYKQPGILPSAIIGGLRGFMGQDPMAGSGVNNKVEEIIASQKIKDYMESQTPEGKLKQMEYDAATSGKNNISPATDTAQPQAVNLGDIVKPTSDEPSMYINVPKGANKYGAMEYETKENPKYKDWIETQKPDYKLKQMEIEDKKKQNELSTQNIKESAQDTLDTIDKVEKGIKYFGAGSLIPAIPTLQPQKIEWQNNLNKLLSGKIVDLITTMKAASKTGATGFGQLSDREGQILREASTALRGISSPQEAQEILNKMKIKLQKVVAGSDNISGNDERSQAKQVLINKGYSDQEAEQMLGQ